MATNAATNLETFFQNLTSFLIQIEVANPNEDGFDRVGYIILIGNDYLRTLNVFLNTVLSEIVLLDENHPNQIENDNNIMNNNNQDNNNFLHQHQIDLQNLYDDLNSIKESLSNVMNLYQTAVDENVIVGEERQRRFDPHQQLLPLQEERQMIADNAANVRRRGRPKFDITREQLEIFDELGFTITKIGSILGVSRHTIINRRREFDLPLSRNRYSIISDVELDILVSDIFHITPNTGTLLVLFGNVDCIFKDIGYVDPY